MGAKCCIDFKVVGRVSEVNRSRSFVSTNYGGC